ncbi:MAG TPA: alpha/beta hydrolase [Actinomycetota bacterium]|nr:alpha/beta hydrolase [Actinomycetota bacterium]
MTRAHTVVLVHGAWHGAWFWDAWLPLLERPGRTVVAVDLPGHGARRLPPARFARLSIEDYARDLAATVASAPRPIGVVAHSLGGLAAAASAARASADAYVLVGPSPPADADPPPLPLVPEGAPVPPPSVAEMRDRWWRRAPADCFGGLATIHRRLGPESPVALNDRYANRVRVPPLAAPGLVVGCELDDRHDGGRIDRGTAVHLGARFEVARGHGHAVCAERGSEPVAALVDEWLSGALAEPGAS